MPIVPVVTQTPTNTPDVQGPPVAPMRNSAPEQIEQTGATLQQAGLREMSAGQSVALRIQEQMDDANVKAAESKFIQSAVDTLHGDNGYMNKQGADAINGYDDATQAIVQAKKDVLDSLGNNVQKTMFNQVAQQHLVTLGAQMSEHRAQQRIEYTSTQAASRADSMRAMAQNSDIGSDDQNKFIETGVSEIQNAMQIRGIPADSDQAQKAERAFRSQITQDNVSRLMEDGKFEDANKLLSEQMQAGNVEGDTGDRLRRAIRGNLIRTENIQSADNIFAPYDGKQLRATDLGAMLTKAGDIKNPEQQKAVQDLVRSKFNEVHTLQAQEYRDNLNDVVNYKAANGTLKGVDPTKWGQLDAADQADLMKPPAQETDLQTWYNFATQPDSLTLDNVKQAFNTGKLTKGDFKFFTERAMAAQKQNDYTQEASDVNGRINYFANQAGMNVYGSVNGSTQAQTPQDKTAHGALTLAVQNEIDRVKAQNHGKVTSDQVDQIIKKQLTQQTITTSQRSAFNPLVAVGLEDRNVTGSKFTFQMPKGATMVVPGSDNKMHYSDGKNDLGAVE